MVKECEEKEGTEAEEGDQAGEAAQPGGEVAGEQKRKKKKLQDEPDCP